MKALILVFMYLNFANVAHADVSDWVNGFIKNSEMIRVSEQSFQSAVQMKKEARTNFFPSVSLEGAYIEQEVPRALTGGFAVSPSQIYDAGIVVEQPVFLGGRIWAGVQQRTAQAARAEGVLRGDRNEIISGFLDILYQKQRSLKIVEVLEESQARLKDFVRATQKRARLGNARSFELSQARASEQAYTPRIQNLKLQVKNLSTRLEGLLPISQQPKSLEGIFLTADAIEKLLKAESVPNLESHPEWTQVEQDLEFAKASKKLALGEHYPSLFVKGKWGYRSIERRDLGRSDSKASELSVGVTIPLFSGLGSLYVRRAQQAQVKAAILAKEFKKKSLLAERQSSQESLLTLLKQVQDVDKWRRSASKALKEGLKNYRLGVIDNFQVVSLQQGLETAETTYIETLFSLNTAWKTWCISHSLDLDKVYTRL